MRSAQAVAQAAQVFDGCFELATKRVLIVLEHDSRLSAMLIGLALTRRLLVVQPFGSSLTSKLEAEEAQQRGHSLGPETARGHSGHGFRRWSQKTTGLLT